MSAVDPVRTAVERAAALLAVRRFADAQAQAGQAVASAPDNWYAWCLLAQSSLGVGEGQKALEAAQTAIRLQPEQEWGYRLASIACRQTERYAACVTHARRAAALAPMLAATHVCLSGAYLASGDKAAARESAQRAMELAPNDPGSLMALGGAAAALGERPVAEDAFKRVLAIDPQHGAAHNELARMRLRGANRTPAGLAAAADGFADALRADPRQEVSRRNLDMVVRAFLARGAYLLFIVAWIGQWIAGAGAAARWVSVALLVIPLFFSVRFVAGVSPPLRRYLLTAIRGDLRVAAALACELGAIGLMLAGGLVNQQGLFLGAAVAAIGARVLLYVHRRQFK